MWAWLLFGLCLFGLSYGVGGRTRHGDAIGDLVLGQGLSGCRFSAGFSGQCGLEQPLELDGLLTAQGHRNSGPSKKPHLRGAVVLLV